MKNLVFCSVLLLTGCISDYKVGPTQIKEIAKQAHDVCAPYDGLIAAHLVQYDKWIEVKSICKDGHVIYFNVKRDGI